MCVVELDVGKLAVDDLVRSRGEAKRGLSQAERVDDELVKVCEVKGVVIAVLLDVVHDVVHGDGGGGEERMGGMKTYR